MGITLDDHVLTMNVMGHSCIQTYTIVVMHQNWMSMFLPWHHRVIDVPKRSIHVPTVNEMGHLCAET